VPVRNTYDWILCNVPARIGRPFIQNLIETGRAKLNSEGDLRLVVIHDLVPIVAGLAREQQWPMSEVKKGLRHTVLAFDPSGLPAPSVDDERLYTRDEVELGGIRVNRPFDLGGDDPKRLTHGLPVLLEALPRDPKYKPAKILCFRTGYGLLPLHCRLKWPDSSVVAVDRDLLGTAFTSLNAARLKIAGPGLEIRARAHFPDAIGPEEKFDLIVGEFSPSAGEAVLQAELRAIFSALVPGGQAYLLSLDKLEKDWVKPFEEKNRLALTTTIKRAGYCILRAAKNSAC
jgi:16S rRNA G1207 methylase RsmC